MRRVRVLSLSVLFLLGSASCTADDTFADPQDCSAPPEDARGFPSRDPDLDVLPGFQNPPPGYGEVPFWWWSGEDLDVDRMIAQVHELHRKGVSGVQVNYSHFDTRGWMTDQKEPPIFSEAWWEVYGRISQVCGELDMGIGLSTYTLDWPRGAPNLFSRLFYSKPELNAIELAAGPRQRVRGGETKTLACPEDFVTAHAYPVVKGKLQRGGVDLAPFVRDGQLTWTAPAGEWTAAFVPTMDNTYGDFRLPVTADNKLIGVEARRFAWARETEGIARTATLPATDDRAWETKLHGHGTRFYVIGPVPDDVDIERLEAELAELATVDPTVPIKTAGRALTWKPYDFS